MRPDVAVFTLQGDGDMANEGLQEVLHAAARGENITCVMLNNGVFGDTGGQHDRDHRPRPAHQDQHRRARRRTLHGYPIPVADLVAPLQGVAYVAARRGRHRRRRSPQTKRMLRKAFESPARRGAASAWWRSSPCARPAGSCRTAEGPGYLAGHDGADVSGSASW